MIKKNEVDDLFPQEPRRKKLLNISKKSIVGAGAIMIACTLIVSAAYLTHFGVSNTELEIDQSVLVNDAPWGGRVITHGPFEGVAGCFFGVKDKVENRASVGGTLVFEDIVNEMPVSEYDGEITATHYVAPGWTTLRLENKDSTSWDILEKDGIYAELSYSPCSSTFQYTLEAHGLAAEKTYVLIYYADEENDWGGNPALRISTFTADINGEINMEGEVELNTYLPYDSDYNLIKDYSAEPDSYEHAHGAKIWLIPLSDWSFSGTTPTHMQNTNKGKLCAWNPDDYLFETDLIFYFDCDMYPPVWEKSVLDAVLGTPITSQPPQYDIGPEEIICLITYWSVDWASTGGPFSVSTYVNPVPN